MYRRISTGLAVLAFLPLSGRAQTSPDTSIKVTFGGFIDAYYAYDFDRPPTIDRSFVSGATFTTQPARHNEFNVNLAYIEANISGNRLHGRLALQTGTSVQSNYAGEPTIGTVSGPLLSRIIQEAYAGYQVAPTLWVDAGIFYSNLGLEGWASKDNLTYTRSLVADYSPYYSSGVRAIWQATPKLTARFDLVNGWQNISETNQDKGLGLRLDYAASSALTVSYYNFLNDEVGGRFRVFNGVDGKFTSGRGTLAGEVDYGTLSAGSAGSSANWWGFAAIGRGQITSRVAIIGRVERYVDPHQVNIVTDLAEPFRGNGVSIGLDVAPQARVLWRTEARSFFADRAIFPNDRSVTPRKTDAFVVSSLALAF